MNQLIKDRSVALGAGPHTAQRSSVGVLPHEASDADLWEQVKKKNSSVIGTLSPAPEDQQEARQAEQPPKVAKMEGETSDAEEEPRPEENDSDEDDSGTNSFETARAAFKNQLASCLVRSPGLPAPRRPGTKRELSLGSAHASSSTDDTETYRPRLVSQSQKDRIALLRASKMTRSRPARSRYIRVDASCSVVDDHGAAPSSGLSRDTTPVPAAATSEHEHGHKRDAPTTMHARGSLAAQHKAEPTPIKKPSHSLPAIHPLHNANAQQPARAASHHGSHDHHDHQHEHNTKQQQQQQQEQHGHEHKRHSMHDMLTKLLHPHQQHQQHHEEVRASKAEPAAQAEEIKDNGITCDQTPLSVKEDMKEEPDSAPPAPVEAAAVPADKGAEASEEEQEDEVKEEQVEAEDAKQQHRPSLTLQPQENIVSAQAEEEGECSSLHEGNDKDNVPETTADQGDNSTEEGEQPTSPVVQLLQHASSHSTSWGDNLRAELMQRLSVRTPSRDSDLASHSDYMQIKGGAPEVDDDTVTTVQLPAGTHSNVGNLAEDEEATAGLARQPTITKGVEGSPSRRKFKSKKAMSRRQHSSDAEDTLAEVDEEDEESMVEEQQSVPQQPTGHAHQDAKREEDDVSAGVPDDTKAEEATTAVAGAAPVSEEDNDEEDGDVTSAMQEQAEQETAAQSKQGEAEKKQAASPAKMTRAERRAEKKKEKEAKKAAKKKKKPVPLPRKSSKSLSTSQGEEGPQQQQEVCRAKPPAPKTKPKPKRESAANQQDGTQKRGLVSRVLAHMSPHRYTTRRGSNVSSNNVSRDRLGQHEAPAQESSNAAGASEKGTADTSTTNNNNNNSSSTSTSSRFSMPRWKWDLLQRKRNKSAASSKRESLDTVPPTTEAAATTTTTTTAATVATTTATTTASATAARPPPLSPPTSPTSPTSPSAPKRTSSGFCSPPMSPLPCNDDGTELQEKLARARRMAESQEKRRASSQAPQPHTSSTTDRRSRGHFHRRENLSMMQSLQQQDDISETEFNALPPWKQEFILRHRRKQKYLQSAHATNL
ncbi:hypothetical protein PTSG_04481 [Salpingoeca rosetta]|uniref:Uncharacterized protein n=1 Tax=Salpingoeca rosetta (strain ATCC 50818 / BSB-021) TaxID=946362 RepID=F2U8P3_SALR5|nr:uncharacterized protein PTSG_04481 [Salpingoeca rosetta]EGD72751.1 hypothetical protein PTSG_04481 [Salpingoeca rosetta]|eukprot:XP_004994574.1 hypothetical protein PTSG_04481 [Salpingoeca rosetta]